MQSATLEEDTLPLLCSSIGDASSITTIANGTLIWGVSKLLRVTTEGSVFCINTCLPLIECVEALDFKVTPSGVPLIRVQLTEARYIPNNVAVSGNTTVQTLLLGNVLIMVFDTSQDLWDETLYCKLVYRLFNSSQFSVILGKTTASTLYEKVFGSQPPIYVTGHARKRMRRNDANPLLPSPKVHEPGSSNTATVGGTIERSEGEAKDDHIALDALSTHSSGAHSRYTILEKDLLCLKPGIRLNDELINFGLSLWASDLCKVKPELIEDIHIFHTSFFTKLSSITPWENAYQHAKRWTKKIDLFEKRYIFVPIHDPVKSHWYLAVIHRPARIIQEGQTTDKKPCDIFLLDSLGWRHCEAAVKLRKFLFAEANDRNKFAPTVRLTPQDLEAMARETNVPVPRQNNFVDCGAYLLHFARIFMFDPLKSIDIIQGEQGGTARDEHWRLPDNLRSHLTSKFSLEPREAEGGSH